jgi:hypothetical protein
MHQGLLLTQRLQSKIKRINLKIKTHTVIPCVRFSASALANGSTVATAWYPQHYLILLDFNIFKYI